MSGSIRKSPDSAVITCFRDIKKKNSAETK